MLMKGIFNICTGCLERCILNSQDTSCSKFKDLLWLDRGSILCRFCKDITQCAQCARDIARTGYGMQSDKITSAKIYTEYIKRRRDRI